LLKVITYLLLAVVFYVIPNWDPRPIWTVIHDPMFVTHDEISWSGNRSSTYCDSWPTLTHTELWPIWPTDPWPNSPTTRCVVVHQSLLQYKPCAPPSQQPGCINWLTIDISQFVVRFHRNYNNFPQLYTFCLHKRTKIRQSLRALSIQRDTWGHTFMSKNISQVHLTMTRQAISVSAMHCQHTQSTAASNSTNKTSFNPLVKTMNFCQANAIPTAWMPDTTDAKKIWTASPRRTGGDHQDALILRGWRLGLSSRTWNPITSPRMKLRIVHSGRLMSTFGATHS